MVRYARQPSIAKFRVREKEKRELSFPLWTFFAVWPAKEEGRKLSFDRISARKTATPCETKSDLSLFLSRQPIKRGKISNFTGLLERV